MKIERKFKMEGRFVFWFILIQVALIVLRFTGVIHWSWWWTLAPTLPVVFVVFFAVLIIYIAGLSVVYREVKKRLSLKSNSKTKK